MTQPEYDQQKRECFVKFCKDNGIDQEVNIGIFDAFDQIFDRAYALGKQKETITQEEVEKVAKDYAYDMGDSDWERMRLQDAFIDGINHIMQLPLCDRMTAEEKERVRKEYAETYPNDPDQSVASIRVMQTLERIFGKDFFKEEE